MAIRKMQPASPAECDRWDTPRMTFGKVGKNTPTQQKAIDELNAARVAAKKNAKKKK